MYKQTEVLKINSSTCSSYRANNLPKRKRMFKDFKNSQIDARMSREGVHDINLTFIPINDKLSLYELGQLLIISS